MRSAFRVHGVVQAVGFRPAVTRLALDLGLGGFVRNETGAVLVEVEGGPAQVARFADALPRAAPPPAQVESVSVEPRLVRGESAFRIEPSADGAGAASIPADLAVCADCLRELFDPRDRRYLYPFLACTACGPRFTVVRALPYDRRATTLDAFPLCADCRREYEDPQSRRYHAEATACPACGPRARLVGPGLDVVGLEAVQAAAEAIATGAIVGVKGTGGFALAVDACSEEAVSRLREKKGRPDRPLAVMARDLGQARRAARIGPAARRALLSPARPIVLAPRRQGSPLAPSIAPGLGEVGVFLPASALQEVLLRLGPPLQVMTSGNRSGEPIACDDADAVARLFGVADVLLLHDRAIHTRADDSVVRIIGEAVVPLRRSRGFVPASFELPVAGPPIVAVGAQERATVCVARGGKAILSQHLGDLDDPDSLAFFEETIEKLCQLAGVEPVAVAHDLHPDLRSTRWALASGLRRVPVQHHHAHVAACLCEHGQEGPAIGVAFDGTGAGPDGSAWGGEILLASLRGFRRLTHLSSIALPGGEAAIREPWRLAVAALAEAGENVELPGADRILPLLARAPRATGAGRWFDAVSALCDIRRVASYEGQAAVELEAAAASGSFRPYAFHLGHEIDLRPTIRAVAADLRRGAPVGEIAARFHETMAACVHAACLQALAAGAPPRVVLTGGCFANRRLSERATALLEHDGLEVLRHQDVPPGDGGLSLGQVAVASALLAEAP